METDALVKQHLAIFHLLVDVLPGVSEWMNRHGWRAIGHVVTGRLGQYSGHLLLLRLPTSAHEQTTTLEDRGQTDRVTTPTRAGFRPCHAAPLAALARS